MSDLIEVGTVHKKRVSPENNELFKKAYDIMTNVDTFGDKDTDELFKAHHMGRVELSKLIDHIEETYGLKPKGSCETCWFGSAEEGGMSHASGTIYCDHLGEPCMPKDFYCKAYERKGDCANCEYFIDVDKICGYEGGTMYCVENEPKDNS